MTGDWLSPSGAARALGLSATYVRLLAERGELRAERTVLGLLFDPASVERYRTAREQRLVQRKAVAV